MNNLRDIYEAVVKDNMDFGTGIWTAISPKIQNKMNKYGEFEPFINEKDFNLFSEEEIDKIAATTIGWKGTMSIDEISEKLFGKNNKIKYSYGLGYYLDIFAGYVKENNYRANATSGGFGTWILKELLVQKEIDAVIHVKESRDENNETFFEYTVSDTIEKIKEGSKTKYYPVELSKVLQYVRENKGRYAIVGVPSFIYSIRLLAEQDPLFKDRIVYTIGLICGHQKSANYLKFLVAQVDIDFNSLINVDFRKKIEEENADEYIIEFTYIENGEEKVVTKKMRNLVGYSWGQGHFKIKASDFTDDVMNETADVTLGDAWIPPYKFDGKGNNILIVRNEVILKLILNAKKDGRIHIDMLTEKQAYASQPGHFRHTVDELPYRIQKRARQHKWVPETRVNTEYKVSFLRKKVQDIREEIRDTSRNSFVKIKTKEEFDRYIIKMKKIEKKYNTTYSLIEIRRLGLIELVRKTKKRFFF